MNLLALDTVKELLYYNPDTGIFSWAKSRRGCKQGSPAGNLKWNGYWVICLHGRKYPAHCLAWLYMTGEYPTEDIDHINRCRADNRWLNLREATRSENMQNSTKQKNNTSGYKGVSFCKVLQMWRAYINVDKQRYSLGHYHTPEDAAIAYKQAKKTLHPYSTGVE